MEVEEVLWDSVISAVPYLVSCDSMCVQRERDMPLGKRIFPLLVGMVGIEMLLSWIQMWLKWEKSLSLSFYIC